LQDRCAAQVGYVVAAALGARVDVIGHGGSSAANGLPQR
jgi:hypothetical protein